MSEYPTSPACELIGHEGQFRLPGGRRIYTNVLYNDASARGDRVRLAYLQPEADGLRQVNRWVGWEQPVEVIQDHDALQSSGTPDLQSESD
jgi:hypothetical protein